MAHRHARESDLRRGAGRRSANEGFTWVSSRCASILTKLGHRLDVIQQVEHFLRFVAVVQGRDDFHGLRDPLQVTL